MSEWYQALFPAYWEQQGHPEAWANVVGNGFMAIATVVGVGVAAWLAYHFTKRHSQQGHLTDIRSDKLRREINALESMWELLAYMAEKESDYTILRYIQDRETKQNTYYVHFPRLQEFLLFKRPEVFYQGHAGLHLSDAVKQLFFSYHGTLMSIYFAEKSKEETPENVLRKLKKQAIAQELKSAYCNFHQLLKTELDDKYKLLNNGVKI